MKPTLLILAVMMCTVCSAQGRNSKYPNGDSLGTEQTKITVRRIDDTIATIRKILPMCYPRHIAYKVRNPFDFMTVEDYLKANAIIR